MVDPVPAPDAPASPRLLSAIEQLFFGYRAFTDLPDRILERQGLGRVHHRILYFVGRNPHISVSGLLDILAVSKQAIHAPLRQLTHLNLIAMQSGAADRRIKQLSLTKAGQALEQELTGAQTRYLRAVFDRAGPQAEAGWRLVMDQMAPDRPDMPQK